MYLDLSCSILIRDPDRALQNHNTKVIDYALESKCRLLIPYMAQTRRTARRPIFRSALYLQKPVPSHRQHVVSFITLLQESRPSLLELKLELSIIYRTGSKQGSFPADH